MLLAGAWAVQVGTATLIDPSAPDRGRAWRLELPEGEAVRVARGPARPSPRAGRVRRGSGDDMIPRPDEPLIVALDVSDAARAEELASALAPHVGHAEGRAGALLGGRSGDPAAHRLSCTGVRGREAARHPQHGRTRAGEHRATGRADAQRARARRRGHDARRPQRARTAARSKPALPAPLVLAVTVLSSQSGEGLASPASLAFEAKSERARRRRRVGRRRAATCARCAATSSVSWCRASGPPAATGTIRCAC